MLGYLLKDAIKAIKNIDPVVQLALMMMCVRV